MAISTRVDAGALPARDLAKRLIETGGFRWSLEHLSVAEIAHDVAISAPGMSGPGYGVHVRQRQILVTQAQGLFFDPPRRFRVEAIVREMIAAAKGVPAQAAMFGEEVS